MWVVIVTPSYELVGLTKSEEGMFIRFNKNGEIEIKIIKQA